MEQRRDRHGRKVDLLKHANDTLGSGSLREAVRLPQGEDLNEWIAINSKWAVGEPGPVVDFFNQISLLYGTVSEVCTAESCPRMTVGNMQEYFWSESGKVMSCSAPVYIDYLLSAVQEELDDDNTFPSQIGRPFPSNFTQISRTITKRLFRIYAHTYYEHFDYIEQLRAVEHVNTSFKHFMLFVHEFNLISEEDLLPLRDLIDELAPKASGDKA